jgi:hypothetical protein
MLPTLRSPKLVVTCRFMQAYVYIYIERERALGVGGSYRFKENGRPARPASAVADGDSTAASEAKEAAAACVSTPIRPQLISSSR